MTAFNQRLRPKRVFGLPIYTLLLLVLSLPFLVLGIIVQVIFLKILLCFAAGICALGGIVFFVLGDDLPFLYAMVLSNRENNNVTAETWTRQ